MNFDAVNEARARYHQASIALAHTQGEAGVLEVLADALTFRLATARAARDAAHEAFKRAAADLLTALGDGDGASS